MNYELFVSLRYLRAKRKQTFISVISFISIAGITLGVAALIVVLAVMTGFHDGVRQQILGNVPHVLVQKHGENLSDPDAVVAKVKAVSPHVLNASPFVSKEAMLLSRRNVAARCRFRFIQELFDIRPCFGQKALAENLVLTFDPLDIDRCNIAP